MDSKSFDSSSIIDRYPLLISQHYAKLKEKKYADPNIQFDLILEVFAVILKYLSTIVCRCYLFNDGGDNKLNDFISGEFKTLSDGNWNRLLRDCLSRYKILLRQNKEEGVTGPLIMIQQMIDYYFNKFQGKNNNDHYKLMEQIIPMDDWFKDIQISPHNKSVFDLFVSLRNMKSHTPKKSSKEYETYIEILKPLLDHLLFELEFITEYQLCFVKEVKVEKEIFSHTVKYAMGRNFETTKLDLEDSYLNKDELYILKWEKHTLGTDDAPKIDWSFTLGPYLIVAECPACNADQIFILNNYKNKKINFRNFTCTHTYSPPEILKDLDDIDAYLAGEKSISNLLKGKIIGEFFKVDDNLADSPEKRITSNTMLQKSRKYLKENEIILALKFSQEAIDLNKDNHEAWFENAMCKIITLEDLDKPICQVKKAIQLAPEKAQYSFALAEIYFETGKLDKAIQYTQHTIENSPSHQEAKNLLKILNSSNGNGGSKVNNDAKS